MQGSSCQREQEMITEKQTPENNQDDLGMAVHRTETCLESHGRDEALEGHTLAPGHTGGRKVRRAKRKAYRPYYALSEGERIMREERERMRIVRLTERMRARGRVIAPYNTTQFIMADHEVETEDLLKLLDEPNEEKTWEVSGLDGNDEEYYMSPTDNEDFISKEFSRDYDRQHVDNLEMMSKRRLMNEYIVILRKNEVLETRLGILHEKENMKMRQKKHMDCLNQMEQELASLRKQNEKLLRHNSEIHQQLEQKSGIFSTNDKEDQNSPLNDTGYESNQY